MFTLLCRRGRLFFAVVFMLGLIFVGGHANAAFSGGAVAKTAVSVPALPIPDRRPEPAPFPLPDSLSTPKPADPDWLRLVNQFRSIAHLPPLAEDPDLSTGSQLHSAYMALGDDAKARYERSRNPRYSEAGDRAARNGNIFATPYDNASFTWAIHFWASSPFHLLGLIDPQLQAIGYGETRDGAGKVKMAAVADVRTRADGRVSPGTYPVFFPGDGSETWLLQHSMLEFPGFDHSCPGYEKPTGPPLILQVGNGGLTPQVTAYRFIQGERELEACVFDETTFRHEDAYAQEVGRSLLDAQDAIVMMPRRPLAVGQEYTADITVDGVDYQWQFATVMQPPLGGETAVSPSADGLTFHWPLASRELFQPYRPGHRAIDLLQPVGAPVVASAPGVVTFAGWHPNGYGNLVTIYHGRGWLTKYAHLDDVRVRRGYTVAAGDLLGHSGNTGNSDMPHLHFAILVDGYRPVDPCVYLVEQVKAPVPWRSHPDLAAPMETACGRIEWR